MLKNNLKLNDTFLVTVEIITSDAIIVSANINSVIFRGTLIRCNKNSQCLFTKLPDSQSSFASSRLDLKNLKRQIRFKTFKSSYNLRRTNNKIIKAKQKINKSENKDGKKLFNNKPLSIKLKKDNGVYINATSSLSDNESSLSANCFVPHKDSSVKDRTSNVIKIVKTKMKSNKYQYSIINKNDDAEASIQSHSESKILKLCITPIPDTLLPRSDSFKPKSSPNQSPKFIFDDPSLKSENIDLAKVNSHNSMSIESPKVTIKIEPTLNFNDDTRLKSPILNTSPKISNENLPDKPNIIESKSPSFTKLKIIKNGSKPNSYVIKSSDQSVTSRSNTILKRYNCKKFCIGDIVWAKLSGYSIWPAKVIEFSHDTDNFTVMWLGDDYRTSQLVRWKLWDFGAHFHEKFNKKGKGNYMNAVQQAQAEYSKLDFSDNSTWIFDISSESSTLESVNIDDGSCELDRISSQESRQNIYLPLPEEEFELMRSCSKSGMSDFLSFDSPGSQEPDSSLLDNNHIDTSSLSHLPFSAKFQLNPNDIVNYNFI